MIFNAPYSSEINPIERLWALGKKTFGKEVVTNCNFKSQEEVKAYVLRSLVQVPNSALRAHVHHCFDLMIR